MAASLGALNTLLVASSFSPASQGFFYTFGSLLTLAIFLDFGLGQTVIHFASHEWGRNGLDRTKPRPESSTFNRLSQLRKICLVWYTVSALLIIGVLGPVGYISFARRDPDSLAWLGPWALLCIGAAGNMLLTSAFVFLQACRDARIYWFYRLVFQAVFGLALGGAICLGAGLWSLTVATFAGLMWSAIYASVYSVLPKAEWPSTASTMNLWFRELWPLQWRIAATWLSAHFTIPLLVVIAFHFNGPVLAGQIGMSGAASALVLAVASSPIVTRGPRFTMLAGRAEYRDLDQAFRKTWRAALSVAALGAFAMWTLVCLLSLLGHQLGERLIAPLPMALLAVATILQAGVAAAVVYMRAHRAEPLGSVSLVSVAITVLLATSLAPRYGALGVATAHLVAIAGLQIPAALWFLKTLARTEARQGPTQLAMMKD